MNFKILTVFVCVYVYLQGVDIYVRASVYRCVWTGWEIRGVFSRRYIRMCENSLSAGICHLFELGIKQFWPIICSYHLKETLWDFSTRENLHWVSSVLSVWRDLRGFQSGPELWYKWHNAVDWQWELGNGTALLRRLPGSHPSVDTAKRQGKQPDEFGKGLRDSIGCSRCFPTVEMPWCWRCWLGFKTNWVSIFFCMRRECLNIRLLRAGEWWKRIPLALHTLLPGGKGKWDRASPVNEFICLLK